MPGHVRRTKARLSLPANRRVNGMLEGRYASLVTARGLDFDDLRPYVRGDDVADLDWKASARSGEMLVKRSVAERRHTLVLVVPTGRSMAAACTPTRSKREVAMEVAGLVGWLAVRQADDVGVAFGDAHERGGRPARGGELHLERCLEAVHRAIDPDAAPCDLTGLLTHVARTVRRRGILLVVCDLADPGPGLAAALRRVAVQHELMVVTLGDVDPAAVPAGAAHDLVAGRALPAWLRTDTLLLDQLREQRAVALDRIAAEVTRVGGAHVHLAEDETVISAVLRLLSRGRRARRR